MDDGRNDVPSHRQDDDTGERRHGSERRADGDRRAGDDRRGSGLRTPPNKGEARPYGFRSFDERRSGADRRAGADRRYEDPEVSLTPEELEALLGPANE